MLTVGVDLAADPARTAVAWLEWSAGAAAVRGLQVGCADDLVVEALAEADRAGVDCPFGWPDPFVDFVTAHRAGSAQLPPGAGGRAWRRDLTMRLTDQEVRERTGLTPLSVSADRIGHPAMRCAALLARLAARGRPVDRAGGGAVVEVYPAASLHRWGLTHRGYKRAAGRPALDALVTALRRAAPWLELGSADGRCRRSDDAVDALVAALTVRAELTAPGADQLGTARREGWIALPVTPLPDLVTAALRT